jgi:hypothetical protein
LECNGTGVGPTVGKEKPTAQRPPKACCPLRENAVLLIRIMIARLHLKISLWLFKQAAKELDRAKKWD